MRIRSWVFAVIVLLAAVARVAAQDGGPPTEAPPPDAPPPEAPPSDVADDAPSEPPVGEVPAADPDDDEAIDDEAIDDEAIDDEAIDDEAIDDDMVTGEIIVDAQAEEVFRAAGSVHALGETELAALSYNDPMAVLRGVPGVYIRSEEGFGLRPNIGIRGALSERSRSITLMEDGVILAPAPYSAPAAYYFPLMARMTGVEVFAGPAAIPYGPNTVGGAIDLLGRRIPESRLAGIDLSLGNTWYGRAHLHYGDSNEWGGFMIEAIHLRSSGFHELDAAPGVDTDTGFHRTDILARGDLHGMLDENFFHRLELTVGVGLEESNETYLGTSDADYRATPYRRYAATQLDEMEWWRTRVQLRYELESEDVRLRVIAYRHDFQRTWYRLDHFCDTLTNRPEGEQDTCSATAGFDRILARPDIYASQYGRLTGTLDAQPGDAPLLMARNHRVFAVQGVQADTTITATTGDFSHRIRGGARLHFDEVSRAHTGDTYHLEQMQMVLQTPGLDLERNHDSAWALSGYASWGITYRGVTLTPGARTELIWTRAENLFTGEQVYGEQLALLPGIGIQAEVAPDFAVFAGAHLGFSPVAPGSGPEVLPEVAWNYEVGARYGRITDATHAQLTYFASDYDNLSSVCTFASGCSLDDLDRQFNAGQVVIMGLEAEAAHAIVVDSELRFPMSASYTWTWTRFGTAFESPNPQLGDVEIGDQLPYVPEHQVAVRVGMEFSILQMFVNGTYTSQMRDVAGQGPAPFEELTDDVFMLDARVSVEVIDGFSIYFRGENLTYAQPILTRRAFGARGAKPLLVQGGIEAVFH